MPATEATYRFIEQEAPRFTERVRAAAQDARNEAEFRTRVTRHIDEIAHKLDVDLLLREEYTLATGRADAVYNRLIIEYELPGSLRPNLSHGHTRHAIQQVKDYITGVVRREKHDRDRLLGVVFDGYYYIFVRYHEGHFIIELPLEVTPASSERFPRALFSLSSGRALIPENLVEDFGSQNIYSQRVTRALYNALEGHTDELTARLFEQWRLFFGEVAGYEAAGGKIRAEKELRKFIRGMGLRPETVDPPRFFFAIHTYFSFLVKNIARLVLEAHAGGRLGTTLLTTAANLEGEALRQELMRLESGGIFRALGLKNLLEGDFFSWYLDAWDENVEEALQLTLRRLAEYNPATIQDDPHSARDLLKKLYHYLLPRKVRHDLGEYYTPDWLAERLLNQLGEPWFQMPGNGSRPRGFPNKRLLDPACGSGTFLILAIRALKANCERLQLSGPTPWTSSSRAWWALTSTPCRARHPRQLPAGYRRPAPLSPGRGGNPRLPDRQYPHARARGRAVRAAPSHPGDCGGQVARTRGHRHPDENGAADEYPGGVCGGRLLYRRVSGPLSAGVPRGGRAAEGGRARPGGTLRAPEGPARPRPERHLGPGAEERVHAPVSGAIRLRGGQSALD